MSHSPNKNVPGRLPEPRRLGQMRRAYELRKKGITFSAIEKKLGHVDHHGAWAYGLVQGAEKLWGKIGDPKLTITGRLKKRRQPAATLAEEWPAPKIPKVDMPSYAAKGSELVTRLERDIKRAVIDQTIKYLESLRPSEMCER